MLQFGCIFRGRIRDPSDLREASEAIRNKGVVEGQYTAQNQLISYCSAETYYTDSAYHIL